MLSVDQLNQFFALSSETEEIIVDPTKTPVGFGGSGTVYQITYSDGEENGIQTQALKVVDILQMSNAVTKDENLKLYKQELEVNKNITACRCEHLIRIHDTYVVDRQNMCFCAIRMPYYDTLEELLKKEDFNEKNIIRLGSHICEALSVLHHDAKDEYYRAEKYRIGIMLHMDIKPSNIFYRTEGEEKIFILGDFGTLMDKTSGNVTGGTRGYLAPELTYLLDDQAESVNEENRTPGETADIFALGMTLYYCLAKDDKETHTSEYWEKKTAENEVIKPENCSKELWEVIEKATAKDPSMRYQTAKEMQGALQNVHTRRAEVAISENELLTFENIVLMTTVAVGTAKKAWEWIKGRSGKKERICDGDNIVYEGEVKNGFPHGRGTFVYRYGEELRIISGNWKWTEEKVKFLGTKVIYNGMKCDGKYSGFAKIVIPTLGTYCGVVKNLDFEAGSFCWEDGRTYSGTWKKTADKGYCFHGKGKFTDAQGNETVGEWNEDVLAEK